jgi:hypothetical protein
MSWASNVLRRVFLGVISIGLLFGSAGSMSTSGIKVVSYTQVLSGTTSTFSFPPANPCGGEPRTIQLTSNGSFRITMIQSGPYAGYYWISPLQRGTFEILPNQPDEPRYSGQFELQADSNTLQKGELTYFIHLVGRGTDGSELNTRLLERLNVLPDRVTISMAAPAFLATALACG